MRQFVIASHHLFAYGLKDTMSFLTGKNDSIQDISAYMDEEDNLDEVLEKIFSKFTKDDEIVMLTDLVGGSVNQKLCRYMSANHHLIGGVNVPLAFALMLLPDEQKLTEDLIQDTIKQAQEQIIYVNSHEIVDDEDDE